MIKDTQNFNLEGLNPNYMKLHTQCPICLAQHSRIVSDNVRTINEKSDLTIELRACNACGHWWHNPMPEQQYLSSLYNERSGFVLGTDFLDPMKNVRTINLCGCETDTINYSDIKFKPCFELMTNKEFNYLEVGCGKGELFRRFRGNAKVCYGVEPGDWLDTPDIIRDISQLPKDIKFDVIVMHDILEHLEDPLDMMVLCRSISNNGARIYCSFPNKDSLVAKIRKEKWDMIRPFSHLHYFSKKSTSILFNAAKWKMITCQTFPKSSLYLRSRMTMGIFLKTILNQHHQRYAIGIAE